jgi:hypothetical protein
MKYQDKIAAMEKLKANINRRKMNNLIKQLLKKI